MESQICLQLQFARVSSSSPFTPSSSQILAGCSHPHTSATHIYKIEDQQAKQDKHHK